MQRVQPLQLGCSIGVGAWRGGADPSSSLAAKLLLGARAAAPKCSALSSSICGSPRTVRVVRPKKHTYTHACERSAWGAYVENGLVFAPDVMEPHRPELELEVELELELELEPNELEPQLQP